MLIFGCSFHLSFLSLCEATMSYESLISYLLRFDVTSYDVFFFFFFFDLAIYEDY
jgi:hypothetical protein